MDEQIVYDQLDDDEQAIWSFLLAGGYLKVKSFQSYMSDFGGKPIVPVFYAFPFPAKPLGFQGVKYFLFWTRPCRKPISTGFGMESLPLCGTFLIPRSKQTHGWNGGL